MRLVVCDRCKKEIKEEKAGYVALSWRSIASGDIEGKASDLEDWDFCMDCMMEISSLVHMRPKLLTAGTGEIEEPDLGEQLEHEGEQEEITEPVKTGPRIRENVKAKLAKAPNTVKSQRGMELAREGRTFKEIMEEIGCTEITARRYVTKATREREEAELAERERFEEDNE